VQRFTHELAEAPRHCLVSGLSGSHAYGLATAQSDEDIRGVFVQPKELLYGLAPLQQVNDAKSDIVYYEIGRFIELALKNNPNILELMHLPPDCIRYRHPLMDRIRPEQFLSKLCRDSFAGYAIAQVKRARGLNKKIANPMQKKLGVIDFCHVPIGQGSVPFCEWLRERGLRQEQIGLTAISHVRDGYAVFVDAAGTLGYRGVLGAEDHTELRLTSIPREEKPVTWMSYNRDGFKRHSKDWAEYQIWLTERNEARYASTQAHGQGYDAKNLMHTFRLLDMAEEAAREGTITVRSRNAERLREIRSGKFSYESLLAEAEDRIAKIDSLFANSSLPDAPDAAAAERLLCEIREEWYSS
jgi:hypothetical protein